MQSARSGLDLSGEVTGLVCWFMPIHRKAGRRSAQGAKENALHVRRAGRSIVTFLVRFYPFVDVVADDSTKDGAGSRADDRAFHLVSARRGTENSTRDGADGGVTLGVLHDTGPNRRRSAVDWARRIRARAPACRAAYGSRPSRRSRGAGQRRRGRGGGKAGTLSGGDAVQRAIWAGLGRRHEIRIQRVVDLLVVSRARECKERGRDNHELFEH